MAENSTLLRALQRFANAARKINPNPPPTLTTQDAPSVLTSLPNHKPLLPLLLSHNIPSKLAKACSDKYDGYASQLKSKTESKLAPYLAYRKKCHPFQAYSLFLNHYNQTLRRWSQSILNTALMSLKRDSVELRNLEVTHLAPLWLPLPPDQGFPCSRLKPTCPLSPITRPTYAFPTTYPPPLRPSPGVSPVEWPRTPEPPPTYPACTMDINLLCNRFATSLIIDENPPPCRQPKPSIFSLPVTREELDICCSHPRQFKKKRFLRAKEPPALSATRSDISLKILRPRRLSAPPFSSPSSRTKATPRKTSAPPCVSVSLRVPESSQSSNSAYHTVLTRPTSPLNTRASCDMDVRLHPISNLFLDQRSSSDSTLDTATRPHQGSPCSPTGPATPPTLLPDLFSEPIVVPATPVCQSPRSSLIHITDPFLQFGPQYDYLSDPFSDSTLCYSISTPGLATNGLSKGAFDTPPGFDHLFHGNPVPTISDHFESALFNTYTGL